MFEFPQFYTDCFKQFSTVELSPPLTSGIEPEHTIASDIDNFMQHVELQRQQLINSKQGLKSLLHRTDQLLYTEATEFLDLPDYPIEKKRQVVQGLHMKNRIFGTYRTIFQSILPAIKEVNSKENRAFKIIEIAGGEGFLSNAIFRLATKLGLKVDITCTDIVEDYMQTIKPQNDAKGSQLRFTQLDAMNVAHIPDNEYDIMLSLHSIHHFSPAQLGLIFNAAQRVCQQGILAVDAPRTISNQLFIVIPAAVASLFSLSYAHVHDATISARKMYPSQLLHSIAEIACPLAQVQSGLLSIGLNYVKLQRQSQLTTEQQT